MNREQLNARALELGGNGEEITALETKADVEAYIAALELLAEDSDTTPAVVAAEVRAELSATVAHGKSLYCVTGTVKGGAVVTARHFGGGEKTFDNLVARKILVSAAQYAKQLAAFKASGERDK